MDYSILFLMKLLLADFMVMDHLDFRPMV